MKIAINGEIIDTKDICRIKKAGYLDGDDSVYGFCILTHSKHTIVVRGSVKTDVKKIRNKIIKIWVDNQSDIPQFNLE